ncbi:MAG: hypothetical protein FJW37_12670 [Acidobacteria bacterium]|nr:hypothetical protein [Acidobacteriota bacterium]
MTWLWATFFSFAVVSGTVELTGSRDRAVEKRRDYSGVVIWLEGARPPDSPKLQLRAEMLQKGKRFVPHVLAVPVGAAVRFPNADPIFHNAFSNFSGQPFDVGLYPPGASRSVQFRRPGVVRVFCNIHPTMSAVIVVVASPYYAVSGRTGAFEIPGVEPGGYRLRIFHERAAGETLERLERTIQVSGEKLSLPPIVISESGYIEVRHKNKYGKDYPAEVEDHLVYPGAKR